MVRVSEPEVQVNTFILRLLNEVIPWQFAKKDIGPEMSLQSDLGIDSLGKVAMAFRLEEEFGVDLSDFSGDISEIRTVQDLMDIAKKLVTQSKGI
jgi:acyl carrier protein